MKTIYIRLLFVMAICTLSCRKGSTTNGNNKDNSEIVADTTATKITNKNTPNKIDRYDYEDSIIDSTTVKGLPFTINGLRCYWSYRVNIVARKINTEYNVRILYQNLIQLKTDRILLKVLTSPDDYYQYYRLADLQGYPSYNIDCKDINKDSWCDYEILQERAAAGANTSTSAYIFNPTTKQFEFSELFSGTNVEYDSTHNLITTFWKMGVSDYVYTRSFLKPNKREVAYIEDEHHEGDSVTYTKTINGKVISKRKVYEDDGQN